MKFIVNLREDHLMRLLVEESYKMERGLRACEPCKQKCMRNFRRNKKNVKKKKKLIKTNNKISFF